MYDPHGNIHHLPQCKNECNLSNGADKLLSCLQGKPYALFGTCLGAITAYEIARRASEAGKPPVTLFTAAVSPPHIYAEAVMKLYVTRQLAEGEGIDIAEVMATLKSWDKIPKDTLMMVIMPSVQMPSVLA